MMIVTGPRFSTVTTPIMLSSIIFLLIPKAH
jgi:hypothetical protein